MSESARSAPRTAAALAARHRDTQAALGRVRDTTLKQCVPQLTTDNRTLDERLKAARSNLRFQDRRIADLEARLAESERLTSASIVNSKCPQALSDDSNLISNQID